MPGPRQRYPAEFALAVIRRPLALFEELAQRYGDVAGIRIASQPVVLVSHPDLIRDVLVTHGRLFHKGRGLERAKMLLGEGLLTSEDELHLRQRDGDIELEGQIKTMETAFQMQREAMDTFARVMAGVTFPEEFFSEQNVGRIMALAQA